MVQSCKIKFYIVVNGNASHKSDGYDVTSLFLLATKYYWTLHKSARNGNWIITAVTILSQEHHHDMRNVAICQLSCAALHLSPPVGGLLAVPLSSLAQCSTAKLCFSYIICNSRNGNSRNAKSLGLLDIQVKPQSQQVLGCSDLGGMKYSTDQLIGCIQADYTYSLSIDTESNFVQISIGFTSISLTTNVTQRISLRRRIFPWRKDWRSGER